MMELIGCLINMIQSTSIPNLISPLTGPYSYYNNVRYGKYNRQSMDLFIPSSATPTGIVLLIHGGGFVVGSNDPSQYSQNSIDFIQNYFDNDIAFGYVNYRLMNIDEERIGVNVSLDCAVPAIDFLISNASNFNIDPNKICLKGSSGGNGLIMQYLHYGLNPINCVLLQSPQASYDILEWDNILQEERYDVIDHMKSNESARKTLLRGVGLKNINDIYKPSIVAQRASYNYLSMPMTSVLGEAYVETLNIPAITDVTSLSHHFKQCISINSKFLAAGIASNLNIPNATPPHVVVNTETPEDFIIRRIGA